MKGGRITALTGTVTLRILLYDYMNSGWAAFDDVTLQAVSGGGNLAPNAGFETSGGWSEVRSSAYPGTSFLRATSGTAAPHGGSYAYAISNQAYGYLLSEAIPVVANAAYTVTAWVRGELDAEDSTGGWLIRAYFYDGGGASLGYQDTPSSAISTTLRQAQGRRGS